MRGGLMMGAALLLAACDGADVPEDGAVAEGGEVLEGTASDAMLPLATVTSQPPLAPPDSVERGPAAGATPTGEATGASAATPSPAAEPADPAAEAAPD